MKKYTFFLIVGMLVSASNLFGALAFNQTGCAYTVCDRDSKTDSAQQFNLEGLIVESAGYFYNANVSTLTFLNAVEKSDLYGIDFNELKMLVNTAIADTERAKSSYYFLYSIAVLMKYNRSTISSLKCFDYDELQEQKGLIPYVFNVVQRFLSNGDVTGCYKKMEVDLTILLKMLYEAKFKIEKEEMPELSILWKINQKFSESKLFAMYTSMVFYAI